MKLLADEEAKEPPTKGLLKPPLICMKQPPLRRE